MGLFSTKKKTIVSVSGAVFRVREDSSIRNTTGLIVSAAIAGNRDIPEAILLNELTGTKSSYNLFNRRCKSSSSIGLPSTSFTYTTINKEQLASYIRSSIGQAYPLASEIQDEDASFKTIAVSDHSKFVLQGSNNYNVGTNVFTYSGTDYYLDSYVYGGGYTYNGHRDQITTTTVTDTYTVYYGTAPGLPINEWRVLQNTVTDIVVTYDPVATGSSSSSSVDTYSVYDQMGDPWGLMPLTVDVTVCAIPAHASLCYPDVSIVTVVQPVSFYVGTALLPATKTILINSTRINQRDNVINIVVPEVITAYYWVVYYTHLGRRYIWIGDYIDIDFLEETTGVNTTTNPELQFAPVVPLRNDRSNVISAETKRALRTIGLDADALNAQITQPEVEDVYVSLFSNLISSHMDQLAYNYAFFEYMDGFGINTTNGNNTLSVNYGGIYSNTTSWDQIVKTQGIPGTLSAEYTYSLTPYVAPPAPDSDDENSGGDVYDSFIDTKSGNYIIRKRVTATTYDEIEVRRLNTAYVVAASGGVVLGFSVDIEAASGAQIVIPFSYEIANSIPPKYRETLFLRCTQIGLFTKSVQVIKTKWYQQDWFFILIIIIVIIVIIFYPPAGEFLAEAFAEFGAAVAEGGTALLTYIAKFVVRQIVLDAVLGAIIKKSDGNVLTQILAVVGYVYASGQLGGGESFSSTKGILAMGKTTLTAGFQIAQLNLQQDLMKSTKDFNLELSALEEIQNKLKPLFDEFKSQEIAQQKGQEYLALSNLMKGMGEPMTTEMDVKADEQKADISEQPGMISVFVANALKLIEEETLMIESDTLLEGEAA